MSDDYKPFPEFELQSLAAYHNSVAGNCKNNSYLRGAHEDRAAVCQSAIDCQDALRDRCHLAELNLRLAEAILEEHGLPFQRVVVEVTNGA